MQILVTGAGGFIGKNLVAELSNNHDVKSLLYRKKPGEKDFLEKKGSEVLLGDVTDKNSIEGITRSVDVVINLAAQRRGWETDENTSYKVNVEGTENLIEESLKNNVEQFIHCSTSSIIGPVEEKPLSEDSEKRDTSRVYYKTKLEGDRVVNSYSDEINTTILYPPLVYGPHDEHHLPLFEAVKEDKIHLIGGGKNVFHPTYIEDCLKGFTISIKNKAAYGDDFIIAAEKYHTTKEIIYAIADSMEKEISPLNVPVPIAKAASSLMEGAGNLLGFKPPLNQRIVDWFTENHFFDISKAREELNYSPEYSLEKGIQETVDWYFEKGWL